MENSGASGENPKTNRLAIIAFICAFLAPLIGLILGIIALKEIKKSGEKGKGLAIAAIIIPIIMFLILLLIWGLTFFFYFGMFNTSKIVPQKCQFSSGVDCFDSARITPGTITLMLRNNNGFGIQVNQVTSPRCSGPVGIATSNEDFYALSNTDVLSYDIYLVKLTGCNNGDIGDKVTSEINLEYTNTESSLKNTVKGEIKGIVGNSTNNETTIFAKKEVSLSLENEEIWLDVVRGMGPGGTRLVVSNPTTKGKIYKLERGKCEGPNSCDLFSYMMPSEFGIGPKDARKVDLGVYSNHKESGIYYLIIKVTDKESQETKELRLKINVRYQS